MRTVTDEQTIRSLYAVILERLEFFKEIRYVNHGTRTYQVDAFRIGKSKTAGYDVVVKRLAV